MPGLASSIAKHKVVPGRNDGNIVSDFKSWVDSNGHKTYWFVSVHPGGLAVAKGCKMFPKVDFLKTTARCFIQPGRMAGLDDFGRLCGSDPGKHEPST